MVNYIIRRILLIPVLLIGVSLIIFAMLQFLSPSERVTLYLREVPRGEAQVNAVIRRYGLDQPIYIQYWHWLTGTIDPVSGERVGGVLRGDLGWSRVAIQPVASTIAHRFPATAELAIWAFAPIILVGIWLGIQAAVHHNRFIDQVARIFSIIGYSFPTFVFGLLMLMLFYVKLGWFAPGRVSEWAATIISSAEFHNYTKLITFDALLNGRFDIFLDALKHLVLPILTLSYLNWALLLRVTRSSMLEALRQDYITTARSKGLPERRVINRHALPNALIPVATVAGFMVITLLNGVVITETIFAFPGIGSQAAAAASQLDVVTVLGYALFSGSILIVANLVVDVLYAMIDPRVRLS
jgi:peptide/nickel transport system permease protein